MPSGPDTSVLDACLEFAERLCADAQGCCEQTYGELDIEGCMLTFRQDVCGPEVDAVNAGFATFDAEAIDACVAARAEGVRICVPTWAETLELRKRIYSDCRIFDGKVPLGGACTTAAACQRPAGAATVTCVNHVCEAIEVLPEGAPCKFPSGEVSVCDAGLACDAAGLGAMGQCVQAVATGDTCDSSMLEGTDCGLGSYCDQETATCQVATNMGGVGCSQSTECVSFECNRLANTCGAAPSVVSRETCLGKAAP
jgi:hypothetical protein